MSRVNQSSGNESNNDCRHQKCSHPHFISEWLPSPAEIAMQERAGRAIALLIAMSYVFVGLSIVSDKLYSAIDTIVSKKRKVKVISKVTGTEQFLSIPIWNETVAQLAMFVLGTCAPEILLSAIETVVNDFQMGEIGPMVILGSSFNLFISGGVSILAVKSTAKRVVQLRIFFVEAGWGCFSYIWLYTVLGPVSKGIVEPWEAFCTLAFFPLMVFTAYLVDRKFFCILERICVKKRSNMISPSSRPSPSGISTVSSIMTEGSSTNCSNCNVSQSATTETYNNCSTKEERETEAAKKVVILIPVIFMLFYLIACVFQAMEKRQVRFLSLVKKYRLEYPHLTSVQIYEMAELEIINELPKSISYYRLMARKGEEVINKEKLRKVLLEIPKKRHPLKSHEQLVIFDPIEYRVMEDCGSFDVTVVREGKNINNTISVNYATEDGTGRSGSDYEAVMGTLIFKPGETLKRIAINIIDDDIYNDDTLFYINLSGAKVLEYSRGLGAAPVVRLDDTLRRALITKIDDDTGGVFQFDQERIAFEEDVGEAVIKVSRHSGAVACVAVPYKIIAETAVPGQHFLDPAEGSGGVVYFQNRQTEHFLKLSIIDEERLSKNVTLRIELEEPSWCKRKARPHAVLTPKTRITTAKSLPSPATERNTMETSHLGKPKLGDINKLQVFITENARLRKAVENVSNIDLTELIASTSWLSQFVDAVHVSSPYVSPPDMEVPEADISAKPMWKDYLVHSTTVFWKVITACVPPEGFLQGWATFVCCLVLIGILMALASDIAVQLGCALGLNVELTAITFIAMGVSLPDILTCRLAAKKEKHADAAIGHMTGRISASIFVGFGLSWSLASLKALSSEGTSLQVNVPSLLFVVVLFFAFAGVAISTLLLRRLPPVGGELGGRRVIAILSGSLFFAMWSVYIMLSALGSFCVISLF